MKVNDTIVFEKLVKKSKSFRMTWDYPKKEIKPGDLLEFTVLLKHRDEEK